MNQFTALISALSLRQKISLLLASAAMAAAIAWGMQWNRQRDLKPLFISVAAEDAAPMVEKLRSANVAFKVADNGTILVPSAQVAELRLDMAAAGLPRSGRMGFEIFDKTNLGATDFAEHVNYRRAIEGELERSVVSLSEVERARVHVTFSKESVYMENRQPAKASVLVKLRPGARLSPPHVQAIQHLTASAVEGLSPESVSILDMSGNLLGRPRRDLEAETGAPGVALELRQGLEKDYIAKVRATLDPLLGAEKYRAGVSIDCDFTSGEQSEETFDPDRSVMSTSQKTEDLTSAAASGGVPGTASSLPRPVPRGGSSSGGVSRKTENTSYLTSRVVRHLKLPQGTIKRLSVAVLVDHSLRWEGEGAKAKRILEPPPAEKLKVVRDVLAGVVGFNQERGDQILVETLPFEATLTALPPDEVAPRPDSSAQPDGIPGWLRPLLNKAPVAVWAAAGAALAAVLALIALLLFRRRPGRAAVAQSAPAVAAGKRNPSQIPAADQAAEFEERAMAKVKENQAERERLERETLDSLKMPSHTKKSEVLKKVITEEARKDPAATAQLLRTWITDQR
ncbi:MAG: flagellar M-ring protein FliF [Candidatus Solibacter usitatus]|nr:flagellar M-ring protein FliF [Candidatus Solibacter usitatus]